MVRHGETPSRDAGELVDRAGRAMWASFCLATTISVWYPASCASEKRVGVRM
jgi:hypothetical protein